MPRTARIAPGGFHFHVLNRGNERATVFHRDGDYRAFLGLMAEACERIDLSVLAYCLMPNHFHLVLQPQGDGDLGRWMQWLMTTHVTRYRRVHGGAGHLWQGRFKSFPVADDRHLLTLMRYVERNPVRAGLARHARDWPWSSAPARSGAGRADAGIRLSPPPLPLPEDWDDFVDAPHTAAELAAVRGCAHHGTPYGPEAWVQATAARLGLPTEPRKPGRPKK